MSETRGQSYRGSYCYKFFCWEVHVSRFSIAHHNWRVFAYTPWLPQKASFQWIYLVYRWILALYFIVHFLWYMTTDIDYYFIYLTDWGFTLLTCYLIWSSVSVTLRYLQQFLPFCTKYRVKQQVIDEGLELPPKPAGCCSHNSLQWYEYIHWILFILGVEIALSISILYWPLFYNPSQPRALFRYSNLVVHLVNGIVALTEVWITRLPVRIYHFVYLVSLGCLYVAFTGIYYAAGGGNQYSNGTYIYPQLDYENEPASAAGLAIGTTLLYLPFIHMFFYMNYLLREALLFLIKKIYNKWFSKQQEDNLVPDEEEAFINSTHFD